MISSHESCSSFSNLSEIFQRIFFDSEIAEKFSLSKTKNRYTILYGIALNSKEFCFMMWNLHHFLLFLLTRVWIQIFKCAKWMLLYVFGMIRLVLLKQTILTCKFSEGQLLGIYLTVYGSMTEPEKNKLLQFAMDGPMLFGMS